MKQAMKMAIMELHRAWDRSTRALHQPDKAPASYAADVDLERLVWDQEYRDEVRARMKNGPASPR